MRHWKNWTVSEKEEIPDEELAEFFVLESFDKDRLKMLIDKVIVYGSDASIIVEDMLQDIL